MIIFSVEDGFASDRFFRRRDNFLRNVSDGIQISAAFRAREEVNTRSIATNDLARPYEVRMDAFRRRINDDFNDAEVRASRRANSARQFFHITGRRILVKRFAFRFIRYGGQDSFNADLRRGLTTLGLINVRTIRQLTVNVRSMINGVSSIVGEARASGTRLILRPFEAFLCHCSLSNCSDVAQTDFNVFRRSISIRIIVICLRDVCQEALRHDFVAILGGPYMRITYRAMI